jgi:ATP-dependent DNA helicase RecG
VNLFESINNIKFFNLAQKSKISSIIKKDRIIDLLTLIPKKSVEIIMVNNYLDILNQYSKPNTSLILLMEVQKVTNLGSKQFIVEGRCYNAQCKLIFFKVDRLLYSLYKPDTYIIVQGKVDIINHVITMIHPIYKGQDINSIPFYQIEINYCSNRLKNSFIKKRIYQLLDNIHTMELPLDWIPLEYRQEYNLPTFIEALKGLHGYGSLDMAFIANSRQRIILDEIVFYNHMFHNYQNYTHDQRCNKTSRKEIHGIVHEMVNNLSIPFELRDQQITSLETIFYDIKYKAPLFRLIQGDVGSGKTIVALITAYWMVQQGYQVAILSPSLTLCQQHFNYFKNILPGINIVLFTSHTSDTREKRKILLSSIAEGSAQIIIGTHSLLSESLFFKNLNLVIFDEHHKFGVAQRSLLADKFNGHILSMTATPSPRTMMLAHYKFLDLTIIKNENKNSRSTFSIGQEKIEKVLNKLNLWLEEGDKIYWVCPKVLDTNNNGGGCLERYQSIKNLSLPVGLVYGQMNPDDINKNLQDFSANKIKILVCTTVIEVGIDIKDATIIIIENAEMFGISQLHQLRGRVGRGSLPGKCLLIYNDTKDENVEKIEKFVTMETGFEVSNLDLELRGPGDLIGINQKGKKSFKYIDKHTPKFLFSMADEIAPDVNNIDFVKNVLEINDEELYLKKN